MVNDITVVIPTIQERRHLLERALASVHSQVLQPAAIVIAQDIRQEGATATRTRGLMSVSTEWTAFLDDDDEFKAHHLQALMMHAETTGADMIFPWFEVKGGTDPFPDNEHKEFDVENPHQTTVTFLVRTEAAKAIGGFFFEPGVDAHDPGMDEDGNRCGEEFRFVIRLARNGYKIAHLDQRTWIWHHHAGNSSGLPSLVRNRGQDGTSTASVTKGQVGYASF